MEFPVFQDNYSRGCQTCQQGSWLCIFLTYLCNAKCRFCISPFKNEDKIISAYGNDPETILENIQHIQIDGISFSGGECFLVFERLIKWMSLFKKHLPKVYFWVYTNGLAVDETKLSQLSDVGVDEIRFNIAASGYNSANIINLISRAAQMIKNVAVEIPSIPVDYEKLISVLPLLDDMNVKYLNLHEYILMPSDPQTVQTNVRIFTTYEGMKLKYHKKSLLNTQKIKTFCSNNGLKLKINNCSFQKKENQMRLRRLTMGKLVQKKFEILSEQGILKTFFIHPEKLSQEDLVTLLKTNSSIKGVERYFIHPNDFNSRTNMKKSTVAELSFLPPMSIDTHKVIFDCKILNTN